MRRDARAAAAATAAAVHVLLVAVAGWMWGAAGAAGAIVLTEVLQLCLFLADRRRASRDSAPVPQTAPVDPRGGPTDKEPSP